MPDTPPSVIVIAGPNGAGKSTAAPRLLHQHAGIEDFVNADAIATGLSAFRPEGVALEAGRIMLSRLRDLAAARRSFAFETTLGSRTFAPWLTRLIAEGYRFHLVFLWLPSADMAVERVARRIQLGGHAVPPDDIRRRYERGLNNLFELYMPIAHLWHIFNTSVDGDPTPIATGSGNRPDRVADPQIWDKLSLRTNKP
jgi:predicted ABC-type ATPase